jgi:hypothetical protein
MLTSRNNEKKLLKKTLFLRCIGFHEKIFSASAAWSRQIFWLLFVLDLTLHRKRIWEYGLRIFLPRNLLSAFLSDFLKCTTKRWESFSWITYFSINLRSFTVVLSTDASCFQQSRGIKRQGWIWIFLCGGFEMSREIMRGDRLQEGFRGNLEDIYLGWIEEGIRVCLGNWPFIWMSGFGVASRV